MRSKQSIALLLCSVLLCLALTSCGGSGKAVTEDNTGSTQTQAADNPVFDMYNKVSLGMTKDQVESVLGMEGSAETGDFALAGTYNYKDKNNKYGVCVVYDGKNILYSKTVIYDTSKVLALFCSKSVSKSQCDKIKKGMPYDNVRKILGEEGVECSLTALKDGNPSVIRRWGNKDGSGIQVVFTGDGTVANAMYFD